MAVVGFKQMILKYTALVLHINGIAYIGSLHVNYENIFDEGAISAK